MEYFKDAEPMVVFYCSKRMVLQMFVCYSEHMTDLRQMCTEDSSNILPMEKGDHLLQNLNIQTMLGVELLSFQGTKMLGFVLALFKKAKELKQEKISIISSK